MEVISCMERLGVFTRIYTCLSRIEHLLPMRISLYKNCDGASLQKILIHGIHRYSSHHLSGIQNAPVGKIADAVKIYRMQWYSSILGGCSSDARSFLKTKPSIKLRFQAAALRVLFVYWPSKMQHASVNPLSPFGKPPFYSNSFIGTRNTHNYVSHCSL